MIFQATFLIPVALSLAATHLPEPNNFLEGQGQELRRRDDLLAGGRKSRFHASPNPSLPTLEFDQNKPAADADAAHVSNNRRHIQYHHQPLKYSNDLALQLANALRDNDKEKLESALQKSKAAVGAALSERCDADSSYRSMMPLMVAACSPHGVEELVKRLLDYLDEKDQKVVLELTADDRGVLHLAAARNNRNVLELFMKRISAWHGAATLREHLEKTNKNGDTPLLLTVKRVSIEAAKVLLKKGANVNAVDMNHQTALHKLYTITRDRKQMKRVEKYYKLLTQHGINLEAKDNHNNTALYYQMQWKERHLPTCQIPQCKTCTTGDDGLVIKPNVCDVCKDGFELSKSGKECVHSKSKKVLTITICICTIVPAIIIILIVVFLIVCRNRRKRLNPPVALAVPPGAMVPRLSDKDTASDPSNASGSSSVIPVAIPLTPGIRTGPVPVAEAAIPVANLVML